MRQKGPRALRAFQWPQNVGTRQHHSRSLQSVVTRPSFQSAMKNPGIHHQTFCRTARRLTSTSSQVATDGRSLITRLKNLVLGAAIAGSLVLGYFYVTDTRAGIHQWLVVPSLRLLYDDAEDAHEAGTKALKALYEFGLYPRERGDPDNAGDLEIEIFGHTLKNPIGTSAGIDKHAEIPTPLLALGPSIIEVGGATPYPQDGNPKPRVFRLPSQKALINRYGLNSEGADNVAMRLRQRVREYAFAMGFGIDEMAERRVLDGEAGVPPGSLTEGKLMAVQVAKNKFTPDCDIEAVKRDYVYCVEALSKYADIIVVNVSSPNTPGLRDLQRVEPLTNILKGVVEAAKRADRKTKPAVMVKVSPDEDSEEQVSGICDAVWQSGVDGVIVGNTTKRRPDPLPAGYSLPNREAAVVLEQGGYSGPQLFERTVDLVKRYRRILDDPLYRNTRQSPPNLIPARELDPPSQSDASVSKDVLHSTKSKLDPVAEKINLTIQRDLANLKDDSAESIEESKFQPLIRLPERNSPSSSASASPNDPPALSASHHLEQMFPKGEVPNEAATSELVSTIDKTKDTAQAKLTSLKEFTKESIESLKSSSTSPTTESFPPESTPTQSPYLLPSSPSTSTSGSAPSPSVPVYSSREPKVIFATGGITNGAQVLEVLNAGASVAMVYTALVYGGVGTISRIKGEMREEMGKMKRSGA